MDSRIVGPEALRRFSTHTANPARGSDKFSFFAADIIGMIGLHFLTTMEEFQTDYALAQCLQVFITTIDKAPPGKKMYVHGPYSLVPWQSTPRQLGYFEKEIKKCVKYNIAGYVLHLPKLLPEEIAGAVCKLTEIARKHGKIRVLLEMPSLRPAEATYETPEKLNALINTISKCKGEFDICVDTAHIWGMGQDIRTYLGARAWLDRLEYPERVGLIHLNGTSIELGGNMDVHQIPFSKEDVMWSGQFYADSGARAFIEFAQERNIDIILEINRGKVEDLHAFYRMIETQQQSSSAALKSGKVGQLQIRNKEPRRKSKSRA